MAYLLESGLHVSLDNVTWYKLTDHNRSEIEISPELIETQARMANGQMRKYVVATKNNISTSWEYVPSKTSECVDGNYGGAWIESFYKSNVGIPIYLKVVASEIDPDPATRSVPLDTNFKTAQTGSKVFTVFMNGFSKTIVNRTKLSDYLNISLDFTEI
jgi:hypothetical protein